MSTEGWKRIRGPRNESARRDKWKDIPKKGVDSDIVVLYYSAIKIKY